MAARTSIYTKRNPRRNGDGESKNGGGRRVPVQIDGRVIRRLSNGNIQDRNKVAAKLVRGDFEPVRLNVAQAAVLTCSTISGIYDALRSMPA